MAQNDLEVGQIGQDTVTLGELAGIDIGGIDAARAFRFPTSTCAWEIVSDQEHGKPEIKMNNGKFRIVIPLKCIDVLIPPKDKSDCPDGDPMKLIGKVHYETQFINSADSLKYVKGLIADMLIVNDKHLKGKLDQILDSMVGHKFQAPIRHRPNPNDRDAPGFVNIVQDKITPIGKKIAA